MGARNGRTQTSRSETEFRVGDRVFCAFDGTRVGTIEEIQPGNSFGPMFRIKFEDGSHRRITEYFAQLSRSSE